MEKKVEIEYQGNIPIVLHCKSFTGMIEVNQKIFIDEDLYCKEFDKNPLWKKVIKNKKGKKKNE